MALLCALGAAGAWGQESAGDIRVHVDVVRVAVSATEHGVPVKGLGRDDFRVREDSTPQQIKYFWQEQELPLSVGLMVDVSGSQAGLIGQHRETVMKFFRQVLREQDRAMLVTVGPQARLVTDFTGSVEALEAGIERIRLGGDGSSPILGERCGGGRRRLRAPCGGTALWQGVYWAARSKMRQMEGRKALIVISDGWDTGSDRSLEDAIEMAQAAETPVYTIKFVGRAGLMAFPMIALRRGMEKLSEESGGMAFGIRHGDIAEVFRKIEDDLRNLYVLGYTPTNRARDGKFRKIEVQAVKKDVQVRTRKGYVAGRGSEDY